MYEPCNNNLNRYPNGRPVLNGDPDVTIIIRKTQEKFIPGFVHFADTTPRYVNFTDTKSSAKPE